MAEYLLTTHRHLKADAETDRGWRVVLMGHDGVYRIVKTDGSEVRPLFHHRATYCLPPHSDVHVGYGFTTWKLSERAEVESFLKGHGHNLIYEIEHVIATETALNVRAGKRKKA